MSNYVSKLSYDFERIYIDIDAASNINTAAIFFKYVLTFLKKNYTMKVWVIPFLHENLNSLSYHYSLSDTSFCTGGGRIDEFSFNTWTLPKKNREKLRF